MTDYKTREEWLEAATDGLRPLFAEHGEKIPTVRVSCGWPSTGGKSSKAQRIGECWAPETTDDKVPQVFISPVLDKAGAVLECLAHELVHACGHHGHKGGFKRLAMAIGLEGKMTATHAGEALKERLYGLSERLGPYPHAKLNPSSRKKQSTRMLKLTCTDCGFICRASRGAVEERGTPEHHGQPMELDG